MQRQTLALKRIVVLSPHLDDAALSLGATIARYTQAGNSAVSVVTVFAGDTDSTAGAGTWDRRCGFAFAAEAVRRRRAEDARACELLGATPVWLPFGDEQYDRGGDADSIWASLEPHIRDAEIVLVPGHPLTHLDHVWLARMVLQRLPREQFALYIEHPYAGAYALAGGFGARHLLAAPLLRASPRTGWGRLPRAVPVDVARLLPAGVSWSPVHPTRAELRLKRRAVDAYASQLAALGGRTLRRRLYEMFGGGEAVALPPQYA